LIIFTQATDLRIHLDGQRREGRTIGLVPTMGALHGGHAALLSASKAICDFTVASVFVNPTQFDDSGDLEAYPRTPHSDEQLLRNAGCDCLYRPEIDDIYPDPTATDPTSSLDFGPLTSVLEGAYRPGHFAGVAQVVYRLLDRVRPHRLFLGQKDYQQVAVIRKLIELLQLDVEVDTVATIREADGLALSSRNRRLTPADRRTAGYINCHLAAAAAGIRVGWPAREMERLAFKALSRLPGAEVEYVSVADGRTLQPYIDGDSAGEIVVLTAVRIGGVRLIDNRIVRRANPSP
jgi:pantoate--beta-alanine ligase